MGSTEEADRNYAEQLRWYEQMKREGARVSRPQRPRPAKPTPHTFKNRRRYG